MSDQYLSTSVVIEQLSRGINTAISYASKLVEISDDVAVSAVRRIEKMQAEVERLTSELSAASKGYQSAVQRANDAIIERDQLKSWQDSVSVRAEAVVTQWETPNWKLRVPTGELIHALRDAMKPPRNNRLTIPRFLRRPGELMPQDDNELLQQALRALEYHTHQTRPIEQTENTIAALRERLERAQKPQEPASCSWERTGDYKYRASCTGCTFQIRMDLKVLGTCPDCGKPIIEAVHAYQPPVKSSGDRS